MQKPIKFNSGGVTLRGSIYTPDGEQRDRAVLFLHGWTGRPNDGAARFLAEDGYYAMTFSLVGHNDSDGDINTLSREEALQNTLDAYDVFSKQLPTGVEKITLVGNSFGGYIAPLVSTERSVNALSMRVPANYPDKKADLPQMGQGHEDPEVLAWRKKVHPVDETRSLRALYDFDGPVQIIEAGLDDLVPRETVQSYVGAVDSGQLDYHLMKDWPHSLGADPERNKEFQTLLLNWLNAL